MQQFCIFDAARCCVRADKSVLDSLVPALNEAQYSFFLLKASTRPPTHGECDSFTFDLGNGGGFLLCEYIAHRDKTIKPRRKVIELRKVAFFPPAVLGRETVKDTHHQFSLAKTYYLGGIFGYFYKLLEWLRHLF